MAVAKTGHLCRARSQGCARGQGYSRTCALHLPLAGLKFGVATGRMAPPASDNRASVQDPFPRPCPRSGLQQNLRPPPPPRRAQDWCCYRANGTHDGWKRGICATLLPKAGPEVRVATEPAHSTFPAQCSGSVVLQGIWHHRHLLT